MLPEEWEAFLRTGSAAAQPQQGYGSTERNPGWEHSCGVGIVDKQAKKKLLYEGTGGTRKTRYGAQ